MAGKVNKYVILIKLALDYLWTKITILDFKKPSTETLKKAKL